MNTLQKYEKKFYLILLIGVIVYFPIFFNGFVWDDFYFILNNAQVHQLNFPILFGQNLFNLGPFYRPISALYFAMLYSVFGQGAFFYHLTQLSLHIVNTSLLFIFFCLFFDENISFFLCLLFLVHPINVESVAYIASSQSELFFLPGIIALLMSQKKNVTQQRILVISALLLLSVLTKETGLLFILLVVASRYIFKLGHEKLFLISAIVIGIIYIFFRIIVGGVTYSPPNDVPIAALPLFQRLLNAPAIVVYYLKIVIFPLTLTVSQEWVIKTITFAGFIFPFLFCLILAVFFILLGKHLYAKEKIPPIHEVKQHHKKEKLIISRNKFQLFLFFGLWFCLGIGMILQIIPLEMTVADRWFYFPLVGLLGLAGIGLGFLENSFRHNKKIYYFSAIILLSLLSLRSFIRTFNWHNNLSIYADVKHDSSNYIQTDVYATELFKAGNIQEAIFYGNKAVSVKPTIDNEYHLGLYYAQDKQFNNAIATYKRAVQLYQPAPTNQPKLAGLTWDGDIELKDVYIGLISAYLSINQPEEVITLINDQALKKFPSDSDLYRGLAIAYYNIYNQKAALDAISHAYKLHPDQNTANLYNRMKNNLPLN
jgi:protein O-mannosyl-transferase